MERALKARSEFGDLKLFGEMMALEVSERTCCGWVHPDFTEHLEMKPCINSLAQSSHGIGFFPNKDFKENRICRFCHKVVQATRAQPSSDSALREGGERD